MTPSGRNQERIWIWDLKRIVQEYSSIDKMVADRITEVILKITLIFKSIKSNKYNLEKSMVIFV